MAVVWRTLALKRTIFVGMIDTIVSTTYEISLHDIMFNYFVQNKAKNTYYLFIVNTRR